MPGTTEFSVQTVLNRVYVNSRTRIGTQQTAGDNAPAGVRAAQEIWNLVFDPDENTVRLA